MPYQRRMMAQAAPTGRRTAGAVEQYISRTYSQDVLLRTAEAREDMSKQALQTTNC